MDTSFKNHSLDDIEAWVKDTMEEYKLVWHIRVDTNVELHIKDYSNNTFVEVICDKVFAYEKGRVSLGFMLALLYLRYLSGHQTGEYFYNADINWGSFECMFSKADAYEMTKAMLTYNEKLFESCSEG